MTAGWRPPEPLAAHHRVAEFDSGEPVLDGWVRQRALGNQASGATRTFVVADAMDLVVGYYAMAAGAVARVAASGSVRRNMPEPIPVMVLARLAVDRRAQGHQLGAALLRDAVMRARLVAGHAGVRALLVHALHDRARDFYQRHGFEPSPVAPRTLMLRL